MELRQYSLVCLPMSNTLIHLVFELKSSQLCNAIFLQVQYSMSNPKNKSLKEVF